MRYCHFVLDPTKSEVLVLLQKINTDLHQIGLEINSKGILAYDETNAELMEKLRGIFAKYPEELSLS